MCHMQGCVREINNNFISNNNKKSSAGSTDSHELRNPIVRQAHPRIYGKAEKRA